MVLHQKLERTDLLLQTSQLVPLQKLWQRRWRLLPQRLPQHPLHHLRPFQSKSLPTQCDPKGKCGRAGKCCHEVCCCCTSIFDLSRPDAYAYIHLSGIPYCDAARQCEAICEETNLFESDHTCIRLYRIAAQIFVVGLSALLTLIVFGAKTSYLSTFALAVTVMYCYLMSTHFADIHSNGAEGLVTCYLAEANCEGDNMDRCPRNLRSEVYNFE